MPFKKGQSGNPGGRPKKDSELTELAREHTVAAIDKLAYWLRSDDARASVSAAQALLDRGWGKPRQAIEASIDGQLIVKVLERARTNTPA